MKNSLLFILTVGILFLSACGGAETEQQTTEESLVEVKNGIYTEYYPGRKAIKYQARRMRTKCATGAGSFIPKRVSSCR
jgi:hypothetical protein